MPQDIPSVAPLEFALPFQAESASEARRRVDSWLADHAPSQERRDDIRLVVSELVGNAVRHASPLSDGTMVIGALRSDHDIDIRVSDGGALTEPRRIEAGISDLAGRGMAIIEALSRKWWIERSPATTTVHAVVQLP